MNGSEPGFNATFVSNTISNSESKITLTQVIVKK